MPETALWAALFLLAGIGQQGRSVDPEPASLFEFDRAVAGEWIIVNDGVMGGLSSSRFTDSDSSFATFNGELSLENNGGFASVRALTPTSALAPSAWTWPGSGLPDGPDRSSVSGDAASRRELNRRASDPCPIGRKPVKWRAFVHPGVDAEAILL